MIRPPVPTLLVAALAIQAALALPVRPGWPAILPGPELPVLLLVLAWGGHAARLAASVVLAVLAIQKCADLAMRQVLGRSFDVVADVTLIDAGLRLLAGSFGPPAAFAAAVAALALAGAIVAGLWWACGIWARARAPTAALVALTVLLALAALLREQRLAPNLAYAVQRIAQSSGTLAALRDFRALGASDAAAAPAGALSAIDRDVLVIFVESYGRTSFDTPFYAGHHVATLRRAEGRLAAAGLAMRSGFVTAPTTGGQSWLSHATFATGLWISDQARYRAALAGGRPGLFHAARRAGFRTAAVMPAITRPWPESARMGFDRVLAAADLGYRGRPFNWVTMPDQFTLHALDRMLRRPGEPHLFAQVALISSHAPWVPVPRLVDWDRLGDGRIFDAMATSGDPPAVVWRDRQRVRVQYRAAIDYSLSAVLDHALRHAPDPPLLIVLGDHQAAPSIALDDRPQTPLHVIGPAHLVDRVAGWGLTPGLIPAGAPPIPMDRLHDWILRDFTNVPPPA